MEQLKKDNILRLEFSNGITLDGIASDVSKERVLVLLEDTSAECLERIDEADTIHVIAHTPFGVRYMTSMLIERVESNLISIANPPADRVIQKREFLRLVYDFNFNVIKSGKTYKTKCVNLSAGSIGFRCDEYKFALKDSVKIVLPAEIFDKEIVCNAHINRIVNNYFVAKYDYLSKKLEDTIAKKLFNRLDEILNSN